MNEIFIVILAVVGFVISYYIYKNKRDNKKLTCIIGQDCNKVVSSKYAKTLGVPNEVLGLVYYTLLIVLLPILTLFAFLQLPIIFILLKIAVTLAAITSLILIFIQAFVIKEWCEWCLGTAVINILIFILVVFL